MTFDDPAVFALVSLLVVCVFWLAGVAVRGIM